MKTLLTTISLIALMIFFYSCHDNVNGPLSDVFTLSGTIENWNLGTNIKLKAEAWDSAHYCYVVLDSNFVGSNGNFSLKLENVPDSLLYTIRFVSDSMAISKVTVNPPNTKSNETHDLMYGISLSLYNDTTQIGFIYRVGSVSISSWFSGVYLYFNQDVSITGTMIPNYPPYGDTAFYNVSGKQGWNEVVVQTDSLGNFTYRKTISALEPPGGRWEAYVYGQ